MIYSRTTAFLGTKPIEQKYKIMGVVPCLSDFFTDKSQRIDTLRSSQDTLNRINNIYRNY